MQWRTLQSCDDLHLVKYRPPLPTPRAGVYREPQKYASHFQDFGGTGVRLQQLVTFPFPCVKLSTVVADYVVQYACQLGLTRKFER